MDEPKKQQSFVGREGVTHFLQLLDGSAQEAGALFDQWANRRPYRRDPEDQLAEDRLAEQCEFRVRLKYLKRKKFVQTKKVEDHLICELSDEGKTELLKRLVCDKSILPHGEACLVLYDVPIEGNLGRDALRYFLKRIGFRQVQKSVWQTDKDVVEEVLDFVHSAKIEKWVEVYLAKKQS